MAFVSTNRAAVAREKQHDKRVKRPPKPHPVAKIATQTLSVSVEHFFFFCCFVRAFGTNDTQNKKKFPEKQITTKLFSENKTQNISRLKSFRRKIKLVSQLVSQGRSFTVRRNVGCRACNLNFTRVFSEKTKVKGNIGRAWLAGATDR